MEKAEALNSFFASVFTGNLSSHISQAPEPQSMDRGNEVPPIVGEDQVQDHLRNLNIHKSMGPNEIHPRVLRELADVVANPLSMIYEKTWHSGEFPSDCRNGKITSHQFFKRLERRTLGNTEVYRLEKTFKIIESNRKPNTTKPTTTPCP
ncbi:hypothetical protein QYF61_013395 [Mycteria americana]|uniref:Uncharacterized protein n=1 Tax=Mycteria americana TaxID=33587 RepID=A0AAN7RQH1_MYCAM|nr:hypothetical protein QYF61_013395 [Mycteria americana]